MSTRLQDIYAKTSDVGILLLQEKSFSSLGVDTDAGDPGRIAGPAWGEGGHGQNQNRCGSDPSAVLKGPWYYRYFNDIFNRPQRDDVFNIELDMANNSSLGNAFIKPHQDSVNTPFNVFKLQTCNFLQVIVVLSPKWCTNIRWSSGKNLFLCFFYIWL